MNKAGKLEHSGCARELGASISLLDAVADRALPSGCSSVWRHWPTHDGMTL